MGQIASSQNPVIELGNYGPYTVTLTATNTNGESSATKTDYLNVGGYTLPFEENFENIILDEAWTVENPDNNETWKLAEVGGTETGILAARINFREIYAIGQIDNLISPPVDLSEYNEAYLYFNHAYAQYYEGASDSLLIYISSDCGETWSRIFSGGDDGEGSFATHPLTTDDFVPETPEDWCGAGYGSPCNTLDISEWAGLKEVRIKFGTYSLHGNPIYIDNVIISNNPTVDVDEIKYRSASVYPNPGNGMFTYQLTMSLQMPG